MERGRPQLATGTYGKILITGDQKPYRARARFRDADGVTRSVVRFGETKGRAEKALKTALADRQREVRAGLIQPSSTVAELADLWHSRGQWSVNTHDTYRYVITNQVKQELGQLRLQEIRPAVISRALDRIAQSAGPGSAKTTRTVLAGMFDYAVTQDAMQANPARGLERRSRGERKTVRALTVDEADELCDKLRSDARAVEVDIPDLVEWMLGTGARIGEACAARTAAIDVKHGTWEINATLIRVLGVQRRKTLEAKPSLTWKEQEELAALLKHPPGLHIQERPKTAAGWRVLALPPYCVQIVTRRQDERRLADELGVLFGSPHAKNLRDPRNTSRDLRDVLDRTGFGWVHSHIFRKTVATRLDEAGMSPRQIADQLGHAKPSMTQDVYMGRKVVSAEAARILDR